MLSRETISGMFFELLLLIKLSDLSKHNSNNNKNDECIINITQNTDDV